MLNTEAEKGLAACYGIATVSWLILLAGLSAVQDTYGTNVRSILGLPWFILCFQLVILVMLLPFQTLCPVKPLIAVHKHTTQILIGIAATLCILMTDRFCGDFVGIPEGRSNTVLAGFLITTVMNLLLIALLGWGGEHGQDFADPILRRPDTAAAPAMPAKTAPGTSAATATAVNAQSGRPVSRVAEAV